MKLNRTGANWDRMERNKINENWDIIEGLVDSPVTFSKRTRAGELATIMLSTNYGNGVLPNYDVDTGVLSFPHNIFIINGGERYTIEGPFTINMENNTSGTVVYFDTKTLSLSAHAQTNIMANEDMILFCVASFDRNRDVLTFDISCPLTINEEDKNIYLMRDKIKTSKRTPLGELPFVTVNKDSDLPNFNSSNGSITFYERVHIFYRHHYISVGGNGIVIEHDGNSAGYVVYFDTESKQFYSVPQTSLSSDNITETSIMIAVIYDNRTSRASNAPIWRLVMNGEFTVDGKSRYWSEPTDQFPHLLANIVMSENTDKIPNFDRSKNKLVIPETFIITYGHESYTITGGKTIDYSDVTTSGVRIYYNPADDSFISHPDNAAMLKEVDYDWIFIALIKRHRSGNIRVLMNCDYTVDGKPLYMPYDDDNIGDSTYYFSTNKLTKDFPSLILPGIGDENSPFDEEETDHNDVYSLFDGLLDSAPDYVSKESIGSSTNGVPIYLYKFEPIRPNLGGEIRPYPKILLGGAIHGGENMAVYALYHLFQKIVNDWKTNEALEYLRRRITFYVVPLQNPEDFTNRKYIGIDDINLNRDFDWMWSEDIPGGTGTSPFSRVESQILRDYLEDNTDSLAFVDCHVRGNYPIDDDKMMWLSLSDLTQAESFGAATIEDVTMRWKDKYSDLPDISFFGYGTTQPGPRTIRGYCHNVVGIPSTTWEGFKSSSTMNDFQNSDITSMNVNYLGQYLINIVKYYQDKNGGK